MEVDLVGRGAVQPALDGGQPFEDGWRRGADSGAALPRRGASGCPRSGVVGVVLGACDGPSVACRPARWTVSVLSSHPSTPRPVDAGPDGVEVGTRVEQRAEHHVAGDAGEAVEPGDAHVGDGA